jgi:hypothetical protein
MVQREFRDEDPWRGKRGPPRGEDQESKSAKRKEQRIKQTSSWRHYYLWTGSKPISVLDPREWTSGVLASSGRVTEEGGADATRLLPFPYRT